MKKSAYIEYNPITGAQTVPVQIYPTDYTDVDKNQKALREFYKARTRKAATIAQRTNHTKHK